MTFMYAILMIYYIRKVSFTLTISAGNKVIILTETPRVHMTECFYSHVGEPDRF